MKNHIHHWAPWQGKTWEEDRLGDRRILRKGGEGGWKEDGDEEEEEDDEEEAEGVSK